MELTLKQLINKLQKYLPEHGHKKVEVWYSDGFMYSTCEFDELDFKPEKKKFIIGLEVK